MGLDPRNKLWQLYFHRHTTECWLELFEQEEQILSLRPKDPMPVMSSYCLMAIEEDVERNLVRSCVGCLFVY